MSQNDSVALLPSDVKPADIRLRILVDWPLHGLDSFRRYVLTCNSYGLPVTISEMMDWGCFAYQEIGKTDSELNGVAVVLYRRYMDLLPRDHDIDRVVELIAEITEVLYHSYLGEYSEFFAVHKRVWVADATFAGIVLEAEV